MDADLLRAVSQHGDTSSGLGNEIDLALKNHDVIKSRLWGGSKLIKDIDYDSAKEFAVLTGHLVIERAKLPSQAAIHHALNGFCDSPETSGLRRRLSVDKVVEFVQMLLFSCQLHHLSPRSQVELRPSKAVQTSFPSPSRAPIPSTPSLPPVVASEALPDRHPIAPSAVGSVLSAVGGAVRGLFRGRPRARRAPSRSPSRSPSAGRSRSKHRCDRGGEEGEEGGGGRKRGRGGSPPPGFCPIGAGGAAECVGGVPVTSRAGGSECGCVSAIVAASVGGDAVPAGLQCAPPTSARAVQGTVARWPPRGVPVYYYESRAFSMVTLVQRV